MQKLKNSFTAQIKLLTDADVLAMSYGEVTEPKTVNYRTGKPEKDGFFDQRIYGPVKDYECACGKYKGRRYEGVVCEKCGVEVTATKVRRERMGHIELAAPVVAPVANERDAIARALGLSPSKIEAIIGGDVKIVTDPGNTTFKKYDILTEDEYNKALDKYSEMDFEVKTFANGLWDILNNFDVKKECDVIENKLKNGEIKSDINRKNAIKRLNFLKGFLNSGTPLTAMIMNNVVCLPPGLMTAINVDGKVIISEIINTMISILNTCKRMRQFIANNAPEIIITNERRMLQGKVNEMIFGTKGKIRGQVVKGLAENIKGKSGRFRQNLLGKRVDYSGRAVIVAGPELAKDQAGIPIKSYLEIMKPTVIGLLCVQGHAGSFHAANTMIQEGDWVVWEILQTLANENFIILNRAPTLHRLGIIAFRIVLTDNDAISLHPLTCKAFNADFDGDQMGMHVPITLEAKIECRVLLLYSNNIINVANGEIIITPRKDVVLGLYYLTLDMPGEEGASDCKSFYSYRDVEVAVENKLIKHDTKIKYYFKYSASEIKEERERVRSIITTPGRIKMFNLLPNDGKMKFEDWNFAFGMEQVTAITKKIYEVYGNAATVEFCDQIMYLGFKSATRSAISISVADLKVPNSKKNYISGAIEDLLKIEEQYKDGVITTKEKENKITDIWSKASNLIGEDLKKEITKNDSNRNINSLSLMMKSGSRVSMIQLLQICGMKGLVTTASLGVIYTAVISSYVEGLNLIEFFISAYGARKGNVDSALKTPFTGYFARKLATVAQSCVIVTHSCGTKNGILYEAKNFDFKQGDHFLNIAFGRVLAEDIIKDGEVLFKFGQVVDKDICEKLKTLNLKSIKLKSPVTCEEHFGICSECYGYDIVTNKLCAVGTAAGIIAAQSIGEPGTQLTLRTFHSGGATSKTDTSFNLSAPFDSVISFKEDQMIKLEDCSIFIGHSLVVDFTSAAGVSSFSLSHGSKIFVKSGQAVKNKEKIAEWDPYNSAIFAEEDGVVKFEDLVRQLSYTEMFDEATGRSSKIVINWLENAKNLRPNILLVDKAGYGLKNSHNFTSKYYLSTGMIIMRQEGEEVKKGDILVRTPKDVIGFQKDITGGLPRVEELFEARIPESCSVISPCTGRLELLDSSSSKNKIILHSATDDKTYSFSVPKSKCILFKNGSFVHKGDIICEGNVNPHDLLVAQGVDGLVNYLTTEILKVYSLQGVVIQLKHIEVIIRYMLRKVSISSIGEADESNFNVGDLCFMTRVEEENLKLQKDNKRPIESSRVLEGVTKASLSTESFIEAATFQEPMRILTEAAFLAKKDPLIGVKENLVIGNLTPIGTGISIRNICSES